MTTIFIHFYFIYCFKHVPIFYTGSHEICRMLADPVSGARAASVFDKDNEGKTAIDYSCQNGYKKLASALASYSAVELRASRLLLEIEEK